MAEIPEGHIISIPEDLREARFIKVRPCDKAAIEPKWQSENNYSYDDPAILQHIAAGGNYGIIPAGDIAILDADHFMKLNDLGVIEPLLDTLFVRSGGEGIRGHFYFHCPDFSGTKKIILYDPETGDELGDLRPPGCKAYCVGPTCIHPSGTEYTISRDGPLKILTYQEVQEQIFSKLRTSLDKKKFTIPDHVRGSDDSLVDKLGISVSEFLMPDNPKPRDNQIEGEHPVHGSTTGSNLIIDPIRNVWFCRRHHSGGGPLEALAVSEGLIDCSEAGKGCLSGHWPAIFEALKKHGYGKKLGEVEQEKQQQKAAVREQPPMQELAENPVPKLRKYERTDAGNSDRLVDQYGHDLRYCATFRSWYIWDGKIWEKDERNKILKLATNTARKILVSAAEESDPDKSKDIAKWGIASQSINRRKAMIEGATPYVPVTPDEFDRHPELINLCNCCLDLNSLQTREHARENLMTKCAGVEYKLEAQCPLWEDHLHLIFGGDQDLIEGFQEACGYLLIGDNPEQQIFFLWGNGKNGKSETMKVLTRLMGDYARNIGAESLMVKRGDGPRSDLARIAGARFVTASEPYEGARLAESVIKQLTGDDEVTVRRLYENEFSFKPEAKIWMATNHKPRITGVDDGIWRRIQLWPFTVTIPPERRVANYGEVLLQELPGILNWCLEGFRRYKERGSLYVPLLVGDATKQYRSESDTVQSFLLDETKPSSGTDIPRKDLYERYESWCEELGEKPVSTRKFAQCLRAVEYIEEVKVQGERRWRGLWWKSIVEKNDDLHEVMKSSIQNHEVKSKC